MGRQGDRAGRLPGTAQHDDAEIENALVFTHPVERQAQPELLLSLVPVGDVGGRRCLVRRPEIDEPQIFGRIDQQCLFAITTEGGPNHAALAGHLRADLLRVLEDSSPPGVEGPGDVIAEQPGLVGIPFGVLLDVVHRSEIALQRREEQPISGTCRRGNFRGGRKGLHTGQ